jgi:hypothetical protein
MKIRFLATVFLLLLAIGSSFAQQRTTAFGRVTASSDLTSLDHDLIMWVDNDAKFYYWNGSAWISPMPGGCQSFAVTSSDATTTGQTLADITGLVTGTFAINSNYTFNATLYVTTSAVTTGNSYGTNVTVAPTRIAANYVGPTTVASNLQTMLVSGTNANNIASGVFLTTASEEGIVQIRGFFTTAGSGSPVFSLRHLKVTSGTSTVKVGSQMTVCKQ